MASDKKVFVYENGGELVVYPPVVILSNGDGLEVVNTSNENVEWDVPEGAFVLPNGNPHPRHVERVGPTGKSSKKTAGKGPLAIVYTVTGLSTRKKAKANSDPVIIIDL